MTATKRAKRLEKYLSETLGWTTFEETKICPNCKNTFYDGSEFCSQCGAKLKNNNDGLKELLEELEDAIQYALEEKPPKKTRKKADWEETRDNCS